MKFRTIEIEVPHAAGAMETYAAVGKLSLSWLGAKITWSYTNGDLIQESGFNSIIGVSLIELRGWWNKTNPRQRIRTLHSGTPTDERFYTEKFYIEMEDSDEVEMLVRMALPPNRSSER